MGIALRRLMVFAVLCSGGLLCWSAAGSEASGASERLGALSAAPLLTVPEPPISLAPPFPRPVAPTAGQVSADAVSRTAFRHLRRGSAILLAARDFHLNKLSWSPPGPVEGGKIERYVGASSAVERLRGGQHVLVSSTTPLRTESVPGHPLPVSLVLSDDGEGYVPANPLVPLVISKRAQAGISFASGLSVTPVSAASAEAPAVVGNSVVFANASPASPDTDLIEEPLPDGAEMSWQLRSQASSPEQGLRFNLPLGAMLRASRSLPGGVEVREEGRTVIEVPPASAEAADGSSLATSYSISGDVLMTHVDLSGNVDFPVLLDPAIYPTYYGENDGAGSWAGWKSYLSSGYGLAESASELEVYANEGESYGSYGELYIYPPGPLGLPGSAGITRVNLYTVGHGYGGQSDIQGEIDESNGEKPAYSIEPNIKEYTTEGPLNTPNNYVHQTIAFCAQEANGSDKEEQEGKQGLCDEVNDQGKSFYVDNKIAESPHSTVTSFTDMKEAEVIYRDPTEPNRVVLNHPGYEGQWLKTGPTNFTIEAEDEGMGLDYFELYIPAGDPEGPFFKQKLNCTVHNAMTECPRVDTSEPINLSAMKGTGVFSLAPAAADVTDDVAEPKGAYVALYLDQTSPEMGELTGTLGQAANHVIGDGNYTLGFSAVDGSKAHPQSGVETLEVKVDGKPADTVTTSCSQPKEVPAEGCFDLSGSWTMNGQTYGVGTHKITVVAKDWAGNESEKAFYVTVNEAAYEPVGPGAVNLQTGDFKLSSTDVSLSGGLASLTVTRTYDSRKLAQGETGPLGPQWLLSLPDSAAGSEWQSLSVLANGSISLYTAHGAQVIFTSKSGGGFNSPGGYQNDTLKELSAAEYELTDAQGASTFFTQPSSGAPFVPSKVAEATAAGGLNKVTYLFTTKEGITEPTQMLAPEPSEGACTAKLVQGCRALTFTYATSTTATGEAESEWGEYKGRLSKVSFTAWEPAKGEMAAPIIEAQYAYDAKGRLRAEWDPQIPTSTPLKTTYGYDAEGHVTAVSTPGHEPWLLHYGASASDASTGRLLSASHFNAETALWKGEALTNTIRPKLSTTSPVVGTAVTAGSGTWSASAVYSYQWERCTLGLKVTCTPIAGATNQTYTPVMADLGYGLVAQVTATNAFGSVMVETPTPISAVAIGTTAYSSSFGSSGSGAGELEEPTSTAVAANGDVWVADPVNHRLQEFSSSGSFIETIGWGVLNGNPNFETCTSSCKAGLAGTGAGEFSNPEGLAINPSSGAIYVADSAQDRIQELSSSGAYITAFGSYGTAEGDLWEPHGIALDSSGDVWVADTNNCRVEEFSSSGTFLKAYGEPGKTLGKFEGTFGVAFSGNNLYVTDIENQRVEELNTTTKAWAREFGNTGSETEKLSYPWAITTDPLNGDLYVTSVGDSRIQAYTPEGKYVEGFGAFGSVHEDLEYPSGISVNPTTGAFYIADEGNNRVDIWAPNAPTQEPVQPPPNPGTTSVTTIDYQVPASGTGAPYALGSKETEEWAQKDDPGEGTAIFPASEPQGWPASEYKHAAIFYLDSVNHVVNTATPSGGISTAEYNEANNNLERTLSPDNRVAALKEGSKSAQTATQLQSETKFNTEGTLVTSTLGPQHTVRLSGGSEIQGRKHIQYFYEANAPEKGRPYNLVTQTREGVSVGGTDHEVRTVTTNYSGQENLGWKLHEPTSVETSAGGETVTSTTTYEPSTGNVTETHTPVGSLGDRGTFISQFGSEGNGHGQFRHPSDIAIDSKGNRWVLDELDDRVEEFNEKNEFLQEFGASGEKLGQLNGPTALAVGANGDIWVADTTNSRVAEFSEKGTPLEVFGYGVSNGKEELQTCTSSCKAGTAGFGKPESIAVDSHGNVWVGSDMSLQLYNEKGVEQKAVTLPSNARPESLTFDSHGNLWLVNVFAREVEEYNEKGEEEKRIGHATGEGALSYPVAVTVDSRGNVWVADSTHQRILQFNEKDEYVGSSGEEGSAPGELKLTGAVGIATDGHNGVLATDSGNDRIEKWLAPNPTQGNAGAHSTQTIYYTTAANATYPNCGKHPEWAGLACQEQPAAQPESGLEKLAVSTYTYNIWDEPLTTTDTVGTGSAKKERTTTLTYDAAGRPLTSAIASTVDKAVPTVTDEYNGETGALKKQSTNEGKTSITSEYNKLGQLTTYTDAGEKTTTYEYEKEKEDRLTKVSDSKGNQTFTYEANTGWLASLKDSGAGTFTASHDVEGNMTAEGYPNGMNAEYTYNQVGQPVGLEYFKTTHCTSDCTWYTDKVAPSIRGEWLSQTSSLSKETYRYDELGRLAEAQETPTGKDCTARLYAYDEDGNRTSLTTRESSSEKCAAEGGTSQSYGYDTADRLDETGVTYETFGNITSLPAADAGGSTLTSSYYVDNALASQEQNGEKISYELDPNGRPFETIATGTSESTVTSHYDGPGNAPAWTVTSTGNWTRNITGINGALAAIQTSAKEKEPVLQLADLHGDIIGTAAISETESKFVPANETNEYGVPRTSITAGYSWLGGDQLPTELPTGIIGMGARTYIPQLGRFLQTDPQPGGSGNAYTYTDDNPVDEADPSGEYTSTTTYNYEAVESGAAAAGLPEDYEGPGAILPPPVNLQIENEFVSDPPSGAATAFTNPQGPEEGGYIYGADSGLAAKATMINRDGVKGSCGCDVWVHSGKIAIRHGHDEFLGAAEVTAGTVGAAFSGFAFGACVLGGGEVDVAIHCILGPGVAFTASISVITAGLKELF
jgi:RHS repeat-associated protein